MSGGLPINLRAGNRSEYLAHYLLSYIGTVVSVPRQEDIGIDFHCTIGQAGGTIEQYRNTYFVQVKSNLDDELEYGAVVKRKNDKLQWKSYEKEWLFSLDAPLFICVCDKTNNSIELYNTSFMWHCYWTKPDCASENFCLENVGKVAKSALLMMRILRNGQWIADSIINVP